MKFSKSERETLTGPAVAGVLLGIVFAFCNVSFNSEYHAAVLSDWSTIGNTMLIFFGVFLLAFVPFSLVPVLIGRLRMGAGDKTR